ncbi:MAG: DsbA family protein [Pseudomonadota bacterium]
MIEKLIAYTDIKSPYAYLALAPTLNLAAKVGVDVDWLPYTLDIPDYLGDAELDAAGNVIREERTAHQWRRVKYSYMDVRRYANLRGLTIRGHPKIRDTSYASMGLLWARRQGMTEEYLNAIFPLFWRRELDVETPTILADAMAGAGIDITGFPDWMAVEGRADHDRLRTETEAKGVFGVPWFIWRDEMFWGREALPLIRYRMTGEMPEWGADLGLA